MPLNPKSWQKQKKKKKIESIENKQIDYFSDKNVKEKKKLDREIQIAALKGINEAIFRGWKRDGTALGLKVGKLLIDEAQRKKNFHFVFLVNSHFVFFFPFLLEYCRVKFIFCNKSWRTRTTKKKRKKIKREARAFKKEKKSLEFAFWFLGGKKYALLDDIDFFFCFLIIRNCYSIFFFLVFHFFINSFLSFTSIGS